MSKEQVEHTAPPAVAADARTETAAAAAAAPQATTPRAGTFVDPTPAASFDTTAEGGAVKPLRIVAVSDTHKFHWWLTKQRKDDPSLPILPSGDVLVHCGDILLRSQQHSAAKSLTALIDFNKFLGAVKGRFKHGVLVIPGNHDTALEVLGVDKVKSILTNCRYLVYEGVVLDGVSFFGCPISHGTSGSRGFQDVTFDPASHIPAFCDVLLTHGSVHHRPIQNILCSGAVSKSNGTVAPVLEDVGVVPYGMRCRLNIAGHDHACYGVSILKTLRRMSFETCQRAGLRPPVPALMPLPQVISMGSLEASPSLEAQRDSYAPLFTGVPSQRDFGRGLLRFETVCVVACTVSSSNQPAFYPVVMEIFPKPDATPESLLQEITPCRVSAPDPARPSRAVDLADPARPSRAVDLADPARPSRAVDLADPARPSRAVDLADPARPSRAVDLADPARPSRAVDLADPARPSRAVDLADPARPSRAVDLAPTTHTTSQVQVTQAQVTQVPPAASTEGIVPIVTVEDKDICVHKLRPTKGLQDLLDNPSQRLNAKMCKKAFRHDIVKCDHIHLKFKEIIIVNEEQRRAIDFVHNKGWRYLQDFQGAKGTLCTGAAAHDIDECAYLHLPPQ